MVSNWEQIKDRHKKDFYTGFVAEYGKEIEEARDKKYAHGMFRNNSHKRYQDIQNDYTQSKGQQVIKIMSEIDSLVRLKTKFDYSSAFVELTPDFNNEEKGVLMIQIARIEAYRDFTYLIDDKDKIYNPKDHYIPESETSNEEAIPALSKLEWNGQKNSLIYLFRQLKLNYNRDNQPLISHSYEDIAVFLKENFSCFNDVKVATIVRQLMKDEKPKKASKRIELFI